MIATKIDLSQQLTEKECELCKSKFTVNGYKHQLKKRFCSHLCAAKFNGSNNKGRKHTEEWKENLRQQNSGVNNPFYGRKHTEKTKELLFLKTQKPKSTTSTVVLNQQELHALDGMMLADGHIEASKFSARITYGTEFKGTLERISQDLNSLKFGPICKNTNINTKGYGCFHFKSEANTFLLDQRKRWYPNNIKIVPEDLILNPINCYWWYVGDGFVCDYRLCFATDAFSNDHVMFLVDQLNNLGFRSRMVLHMNEGKLRPRVHLGGQNHANNFLQWLIDNNNIQEEYLYKFRNENRRKQWIKVKV